MHAHSAFILAGATATGKTAVAQHIAERAGYTILSADAMLVYQGMDIGTAKPSRAERGEVPYFGLDLVTPAERFSTGRWIEAAQQAIAHDQQPLLVVGGTGLYIKALTEGIEAPAADETLRAKWNAFLETQGLHAVQTELQRRAPDWYATMPDPQNPRRLLRALEQLDATGTIPTHWQDEIERPPIVVLRLPRNQLHARIARRIRAMFDAGLVEEVDQLRTNYPVWSDTAQKAIGYAEILDLLAHRLTRQEAEEQILIRTRQLAKRQETWFRHQANALWLDIDASDTPAAIAARVETLWRQHGATPLRLA